MKNWIETYQLENGDFDILERGKVDYFALSYT